VKTWKFIIFITPQKIVKIVIVYRSIIGKVKSLSDLKECIFVKCVQNKIDFIYM
jgi:hypothetical protein